MPPTQNDSAQPDQAVTQASAAPISNATSTSTAPSSVNTQDTPLTSSAKPIRPRAITVICGLAFLGLLLSGTLIFSPAAQKIGAWYPPYLALSTIIGAISFIGLWMMKRWSVILYAIFVAVNQVLLLATAHWSFASLLIPLLVVGIGFKYFKDMQ